MTMNLLRQIATSRLPVSFYRTEDIDSVRLLRAAGLVVALVPSPFDPIALAGTPSAAQVLAITSKGREELAKFDYPVSRPPRWRLRMPRIKTLARAGPTAPPPPHRESSRLQ
ncbi:hypothetical protein [Variovorax sp. Varisp62]|uniref:hypothetical protein n=1 Tax=Variovorax sp. Varisp62 TaxID=3243049 RepID=UPI0039B3C6F6